MSSIKDIPDFIQWHEGMLLQPQHFQQLCSRYENLIYYHNHLIAPYHWGVIHLEVDTVQILHGKYKINKLQAIMPDGLLIHYEDEKEQTLECDFSEHFETANVREVTLHLAVAAQKINPLKDRYLSAESEIYADFNITQNRISMPVLKPKLAIISEDKVTKSVVSFPIVKIQYRENVFSESSFVPPLLQTKQNNKFGKRCRTLIESIRHKASVLDEDFQSLDIRERDKDSAGLKYKIERLVSELPVAEALIKSNHAHPFQMYLAFCSMIGKIACLNLNVVPPILNVYDHNNIDNSFSQIEKYIEITLNQLVERYQSIIIKPEDSCFTINPQYFNTDKPIIIGIYAGIGRESDAVSWIESAFIASEDQIEQIIRNRVHGTPRKNITYYEPFNLAPSKGIALFSIDTNNEFVKKGTPLLIQGMTKEYYLPTPEEIILYIEGQQ